MITAEQMVQIKERVLTAAAAARQIAGAPEQFVLYDQEEYERVMRALLSLHEDLSTLLAEHDLLRVMFAERVAAFLSPVMEVVGHGDADDGAQPVGEGATQPSGGSGEAAQPDDSVPAGDVPAKRARRRGRRGPKPKGDRPADGNVQEELVARDGGVSEDGASAHS